MSVLEMMEAAKRCSVIHGLSPFTKLLFCIAMIAIPIITFNPFVSLILLLVLWILPIPAKVGDVFYKTMRKLYPVMLIFIIIIWPFFYGKGDHVILHAGILNITWEGVYFGIAQALRVAVAITGCLYFIMITELIDISNALGRAFQQIGVGFMGPFMFTTTFKFLPEFMTNFTTTKEAFAARGFQLDKGSFAQKIRNYIPLFVPLIDTSLGKATNIASAMQLRAFGIHKKRTFYTRYYFGIGDILFLILVAAMVAFAIWGRIVHLGGFNLTL